jgi:wobble nucleotide-excising tRNase
LIKGIAKIKGLGVYEDYTKPNDTKDFGVKNLIYGWNYSGKTTLSRLFSLLESKIANPDLNGCSFSFETDGEPITDANYPASGLIVRVFNSDFIRDNLHFGGEGFKPVLLLGKDSDVAQKKIDDMEQRIKDSQEFTRDVAISVRGYENTISQAKTEAAKQIRQTLKVDPYTATQLSSDMLGVGVLDSQLLSDKDFGDSLELALTPDNKKPGTVDRLSASLLIEGLHKEASLVLTATPTFSNTIKHLEDNPSVERWVETGLPLHDEKENCEFCGSKIAEDRIAALRAHFSKDLGDHKQKVANLLLRVKAAQIKLNLPKEAEFNPQFREKYKELLVALAKTLTDFNQAVVTLAEDIQRKVDTPLKSIEPTLLVDGLSTAVTDAIGEVNALIDENNELAANFSKAKVAAVKRVKYHYVQELVDALERSGGGKKITRLKGWQERINKFVTTLQREIDKLQALISHAQLGREKVNERLASMLGSEAVQMSVVKDAAGQERFQLVRKGGKIARNLSDGERTAIAFSYFLTKLQELKPEQFEQTIVYIDDPISSLDANHLFQINAAIKENFFWKNAENKWTTRCKQFFLSTHNFQFFDLVRELEPKNQPRAQLYFLRKVSSTQSIFGDMPKSLCKYSSEYHFLFETILKFRSAQDKGAYEALMLLPNAVRRFTELYTYSRIPVDVDGLSVDRRAEILFGPETSKRILKVLHYFSHGNNMEKFLGNNELIFDVEHAVNDLLTEIEQKDPLHWKALMDAVQ